VAPQPSCSQYPTEIHDQIQSENVGVKARHPRHVRCNIGHDALYRHAASTLYPGKTHSNHLLAAACRVSWIPSAAAVRAGDDFKQVTVRVFEVDTASAVVVIDLT
jgi:hypothetical protein